MNDERENDDKGDSGEEEETASRPAPKRGPQSATEILTRGIVQQGAQASPKLKELLAGTIEVSLSNTGKRYRVKWADAQLTSEEVSHSENADCEIVVTEENLQRIAAGELNPQVAMLSDKVKVKGKQGLAMYFFNLVAPRNF